jgi:hypothetical protein
MLYSQTSGWSFVVLLVLCCAASTSAPAAQPVPFYNFHVLRIEKIGDGSVIIRTSDPPDVVHAWYRRNIRDANGETTTEDGAYILYTANGATVDIERGDPGDSGTSIGIVWDAEKYGPYAPFARGRHARP